MSSGTARPSSIARTSACSAASRSAHGPACRRTSRAVAAANRARLSDSVRRSTSAPHTFPQERREVARVHPHIGRSERPEMLLGRGSQFARPRQVQHALAAARLDRLPQHGRLPGPGPSGDIVKCCGSGVWRDQAASFRASVSICRRSSGTPSTNDTPARTKGSRCAPFSRRHRRCAMSNSL